MYTFERLSLFPVKCCAVHHWNYPEIVVMFGQIESTSHFHLNAVKFTIVNRKLQECINRKFAFLNNKSSTSTLNEGTSFFQKIQKGKLPVTLLLIGALVKEKHKQKGKSQKVRSHTGYVLGAAAKL